jgi:trimethylamine:corrinoid methyltransferase-like protein
VRIGVFFYRELILEILETIGIRCPSDRALKIYAEHGAKVDFATKVVKFTPDVIMKALSHAPQYYTMRARSQSHAIFYARWICPFVRKQSPK